MKAIHKKRLLKLADHLEKGKLGHKKFDFSVVNADTAGNELAKNGCGFAGCAIGECPIAFPREWCFTKGAALLRGRKAARSGLGNRLQAFSSAEDFFGLTKVESYHLFSPGRQFHGSYLGIDATPKQVARNIRAFVKREDQASHSTKHAFGD